MDIPEISEIRYASEPEELEIIDFERSDQNVVEFASILSSIPPNKMYEFIRVLTGTYTDLEKKLLGGEEIQIDVAKISVETWKKLRNMKDSSTDSGCISSPPANYDESSAHATSIPF